MSDIINAHLPCPDCGSSDGMTEYTDHTFCFVCEKWTPTGGGRRNAPMPKGLIPMGDMEYRALRARGIREDTCRKYHYTCTRDNHGNPLQVANYYGDEGRIIFQKTRDKDKNFCVLGEKQHRFFGQHLFQHFFILIGNLLFDFIYFRPDRFAFFQFFFVDSLTQFFDAFFLFAHRVAGAGEQISCCVCPLRLSERT